MRFYRKPRPTGLGMTDRKRQNIVRKQERERQALPLLAAIVAEQQPSIADEEARRETAWAEWQASWRKTWADMWRDARRQFYALQPDLRQRVRHEWNTCRYPGNPEYLLHLLREVTSGRRQL